MKTLVIVILVLVSEMEIHAQTLPWGGTCKPIDSCDFTNVCNLIEVDTGSVGTKWVIAQNTKSGWDTQISLGNGLITDSTQPYLPGTRTMAELKLKIDNDAFNYGNAILGFKHLSLIHI